MTKFRVSLLSLTLLLAVPFAPQALAKTSTAVTASQPDIASGSAMIVDLASKKIIYASQPDLVVISTDGLQGMGGEASLWKLPGLAQTPAGRHQQVLVVDDMALLGFGPRTPQALLQLRQKAEQLP